MLKLYRIQSFFKRTVNSIILQEKYPINTHNYSTWPNREQRKTTKPLKISKKIGFIGDGNMAKAICCAIQEKGLIEFSQVYVSSPYRDNLNIWAEKGANISIHNADVVKSSDIVFLAVKPQFLKSAIDGILQDKDAKNIKNKLFISILAGFTLQDLEEYLRHFEGSRIIRVMPNTPVMVSEGCTVFCSGKNTTKEDIDLLSSIMNQTGVCLEVREDFVDAIGAVAASGPAYAYLFIEALSDGGVRMGLHREMATQIAAQMMMGAAKMVLETGKHMGVLKDEVCSAGGTTIAGIHALEKGGVRGSIMNAVEAATLRAKELRKVK